MTPETSSSRLLKRYSFQAHVLKEILLYRFSPKSLSSRRHLTQLKDRHRGQRCFILGNGPSLGKTDLSHLRNEFTFGLNRIYLMFPALGFPTTYLVSVNKLVIEQCLEEILSQPCHKFLPWGLRNDLQMNRLENLTFLQVDALRPGFCTDARGAMWQGATVTYIALQLAYHMGFQQAVLVGVDHSFVTSGQPHTEVVSQGDDPNHFSPDYFGKGFRWMLPDLETSEFAYGLARKAFERDHREILDATIGGKLTIFPKVSYDSLF